MLFHEIYSTYFQTVAKILAEAVEHPLTTEEINAIIRDYAFEESILKAMVQTIVVFPNTICFHLVNGLKLEEKR